MGLKGVGFMGLGLKFVDLERIGAIYRMVEFLSQLA